MVEEDQTAASRSREARVQGFEKAKEALLSGSALKAFKKLQQLSET